MSTAKKSKRNTNTPENCSETEVSEKDFQATEKDVTITFASPETSLTSVQFSETKNEDIDSSNPPQSKDCEESAFSSFYKESEILKENPTTPEKASETGLSEKDFQAEKVFTLTFASQENSFSNDQPCETKNEDIDSRNSTQANDCEESAFSSLYKRFKILNEEESSTTTETSSETELAEIDEAAKVVVPLTLAIEENSDSNGPSETKNEDIDSRISQTKDCEENVFSSCYKHSQKLNDNTISSSAFSDWKVLDHGTFKASASGTKQVNVPNMSEIDYQREIARYLEESAAKSKNSAYDISLVQGTNDEYTRTSNTESESEIGIGTQEQASDTPNRAFNIKYAAEDIDACCTELLSSSVEKLSQVANEPIGLKLLKCPQIETEVNVPEATDVKPAATDMLISAQETAKKLNLASSDNTSGSDGNATGLNDHKHLKSIELKKMGDLVTRFYHRRLNRLKEQNLLKSGGDVAAASPSDAEPQPPSTSQRVAPIQLLHQRRTSEPKPVYSSETGGASCCPKHSSIQPHVSSAGNLDSGVDFRTLNKCLGRSYLNQSKMTKSSEFLDAMRWPLLEMKSILKIELEHQYDIIVQNLDQILERWVFILKYVAEKYEDLNKICGLLRDDPTANMEKSFKKAEQDLNSIYEGLDVIVEHLTELLENVSRLSGKHKMESGLAEKYKKGANVTQSDKSEINLEFKGIKTCIQLIHDGIIAKGAKETRLKKILGDILRLLDAVGAQICMFKEIYNLIVERLCDLEKD